MKSSKIVFDVEQSAYEHIIEALKNYGDYEIGGILIGYEKSRNHFAISDVTVANDINKFNVFSFIREPMKSLKILIRSFKKKKHSYIGEWHSHPKFSLYPSPGDIATMKGILTDPGYGVDFVLLIITKLNERNVEMAGFLFHKKLKQYVRANVIYKNINLVEIHN